MSLCKPWVSLARHIRQLQCGTEYCALFARTFGAGEFGCLFCDDHYQNNWRMTTTLTKTAALSVLLGIFIFFVVVFFVFVGCNFCLLWLRRRDEDQQELLHSARFTAKDIDNDEVLGRCRQKRNHNDEVFEMEVLHCNDCKDEMTDFPAQFV